MSFGPSDIVKGIELAFKIYQYGFCEENTASVCYRVFMKDINNFHTLLSRLNVTLQGAEDRYRLECLANDVLDPLAAEIEDERKHIIGNFLATLEDCEALLKRNEQYGTQSSSRFQNIISNINQHEQQANRLRDRLRFHSIKITLVLNRLSVELLTDIDAKIDDIRDITEETLRTTQDIQSHLRRAPTSSAGGPSSRPQPLPSVDAEEVLLSHDIASRFQQSLSANTSISFESGLPLVQGFDALMQHYQRFKDMREANPETYLMFLKVRWLLDRLKKGSEYQDARPGFYYKRAIRQIEQKVLARKPSSGDLLEYDDATLLSLDDTHFQIWPPSTPATEDSTTLDPLDLGPLEEQIASLDLATSGPDTPDTVTVIRSSNDSLRVVRQRTSDPNRIIITSQTIQVDDDKLIPRYALPTLQHPCLELVIFSRNIETVYSFKTLENLLAFQSALMGYNVSHDQQRIHCRFSRNVNALNCTGRVQIWQDPIPATKTDATSPVSAGSLDSFSRTSASGRDSLHPSLAGTSTIAATESGWQGGRIKLPVIAIITMLQGRDLKHQFAAITIELRPGVQISPHNCRCHHNYDTCLDLVLLDTTRSHKKLIVRTIYSDSDAEGRPVATTFDIFPLRAANHTSLSAVNTRQTEHLLLHFDTVAEKKHFKEQLDIRLRLRDAQIWEQMRFERNFRHRADRPQRQAQDTSSSLRRDSSTTRRTSFASTMNQPHSSTRVNHGSDPSRSNSSNVGTMTAPPETAATTSPPTVPIPAPAPQTTVQTPQRPMRQQTTAQTLTTPASDFRPMQADVTATGNRRPHGFMAFMRSL